MTHQFSVLKRLPEDVESMKKGDQKIECCEVYELNKLTKSIFPRGFHDKVEKKILDIVHTYFLGNISPETVDSHCIQLE